MTAAMAESPFSPEVIAAVMRHMNDDHADDNVVICRALGGQPNAMLATMTGMDAHGIQFVVVVDDREVEVGIPWRTPPVVRADVRTEVVRMYQEAQESLGPSEE